MEPKIKTESSCKTIDFNEKCLYFVAKSLSRTVGSMVENSFSQLGFSPSYGYLLLLIIEEPKHTQNELAKRTNLKPSTITRFLEQLEDQHLISKQYKGRTCIVEATQKGERQRDKILKSLKHIYEQYCAILGEEHVIALTKSMFEAERKFFQATQGSKATS